MAMTLHPHNPDDLLTLQAPVVYDPAATAPMWDAFLEQILPDAEVRGWVQQYFGYALVGRPVEQVVAIAYGSGANGKSTLSEVISGVLGPYAMKADIETFPTSRYAGGGAGATPDLARLKGARIVFASESGSARRLNVARIKDISGGEAIVARRLYGEPFEFRPMFSLWISTNDKPTVPWDDYALWRRLRLIPFTVTVPEEKRIPDLARKILSEERSGVLNWLLAGLGAWQRAGRLPKVTAIEVATAEYRLESDLVGQWIDAACEVGPGVRTPAGKLYAAFRNWAVAEDPATKPPSQQAFGRDLTKRGFPSEPGRDCNWRLGLALRQPRYYERES